MTQQPSNPTPDNPIKPEPIQPFDQNFDRGFAIVSTVVVLVSLWAGFWVLGSPDQQRLMSLDRQRRQDLWSMANDFYLSGQSQLGREKLVLPQTLSVTSDQAGVPRLRLDPDTQKPYEYKRLSDTTYQLCAIFATDTRSYPLRNPNQSRWWHHGKGRHCFTFNAKNSPSGDYSW